MKDVCPHSLATARNREAIAEVLKPLLLRQVLVLVIVRGSGEHVCYFQRQFAASLPWLHPHGSDPDPLQRCRPGQMTSTPVKEFIETKVRGRKFRVPKPYYDLDGAAWKRALDLMEQAEDYDDGAQRLDRTSLVFPDQQSATARCITSLESEVETMVDVVGRLQQQLNWRKEAVELQCNQSLLEQEVGLV